MSKPEIFNPETMSTPMGLYSHVARAPASATLVVIAGQVAVDRDGRLVGAGDFAGQCDQVFANIGTALEAAGADWSNVIQTMTFLTRREDIPALRGWREREFARLLPSGRYPPNTLLVVSALARDDLLLEVQATAAI
jgi:enamine deaminase RidA (YjgF/YER057c/UK114 family)